MIIEAMKLALDALEECRRDPRLKYEHPTYEKVITALRQAIDVATNDTSQERVNEIQKQRHDTAPPQHQPEQKLLRFTNRENWLSGNGRIWSEMHKEDGDFPVYTAPPQRQWIGLTDEEFQWIYDNGWTPAGMMELTEAKLKEKNA